MSHGHAHTTPQFTRFSFNASVRYGISYWMWGDADVVDTITARFGINQCVYLLMHDDG